MPEKHCLLFIINPLCVKNLELNIIRKGCEGNTPTRFTSTEEKVEV
jgi:hypothetical protein